MLRLGDKVLSERIKNGLSIPEISKKTGVEINEIYYIEKEHLIFIEKELFYKLANILDLREYEIFTYEKMGELLGKKIKQARLKMGYTQKQLSEVAHLSSPTFLSRLEKGHCSKINEKTFKKLKNALPLDREDFEFFIQKRGNTTQKEKKKEINFALIQDLMVEKRQKLKLSRESLGKMAGVSSRTIKRIEEKSQKSYNKQKLLQIMYALHFSEEEIEKCFLTFEGEELNEKETPNELQKKI